MKHIYIWQSGEEERDEDKNIQLSHDQVAITLRHFLANNELAERVIIHITPEVKKTYFKHSFGFQYLQRDCEDPASIAVRTHTAEDCADYLEKDLRSNAEGVSVFLVDNGKTKRALLEHLCKVENLKIKSKGDEIISACRIHMIGFEEELTGAYYNQGEKNIETLTGGNY